MQVFIGVDPHKQPATIEVLDMRETVTASGRVPTNKVGYSAKRKHVALFGLSAQSRAWLVSGVSPGEKLGRGGSE